MRWKSSGSISGGEASERQWIDVLGVIKLHAESLNPSYMQRWAGTLGIDDLLERALTEGG